MNRLGILAAMTAAVLSAEHLVQGDWHVRDKPRSKGPDAKVNNPAGSKYRRRKNRKHSQIGRLFHV